MKISVLSLALAGLLATAAPVAENKADGFDIMSQVSSELSKRQNNAEVRNELGLCRRVTVIYARGTCEAALFRFFVMMSSK